MGSWAPSVAVLALLVVPLRRPVALALAGPILGSGLRRRGAALRGWSGPLGVAALCRALHAGKGMGEALVRHAAGVAIAVSAARHGLTSRPGLPAHRRAAGGDARPPPAG